MKRVQARPRNNRHPEAGGPTRPVYIKFTRWLKAGSPHTPVKQNKLIIVISKF